ncbi:MAPEG family protein [Roseomonas sp. HJA6]|uniref:MAPEG family protein n=1 Tax=Roseomonas alba TaxID=2846776 RepID=A0ABS7AGW9_9PROT|nr:MAPEG family protein [Neoroseomonas alba]MBW6401545.1 MAPEG family protein [Neoroseomonas alba]
MPQITASYAGLLIALFILLTLRVFAVRQPSGIMLGTGGNRLLERAVRVHANFAEYVPLFLVAIAAAELCGAPGWALHAAGMAMLVGRVLHAIGLSQEPDIVPLRAAGIALTLLALVIAGVLALGGGLGLW